MKNRECNSEFKDFRENLSVIKSVQILNRCFSSTFYPQFEIIMANPPAPMTTQQFIDLGKVPDFVRDIKHFSGDPTKLVDWIADVEAIFRTYRENGATAAQQNILERTVRRKIEGEAADILNSNNIASNWSEIKNALILYYKDQRDIKTLDYQLTSIRKSASENLNTYYSRVNELLSLIIAQIRTDDTMRLSASAHINYFREKALDAFIRGLEKPLNILLKSSNPATLSQAYNFCIEYHNLDIRSAPFRNELSGQPVPKPRALPEIPPKVQIQPKLFFPPPIPPRRQSMNPFQNNFQHTQGFPAQNQLRNNPFGSHPQNNPFRQNPFQNNRQNNPFGQNPFRQNTFQNNASNRPEPMEVDPSQQTRALNYGNRPMMNLKRPHPPSTQQHNFKRQAHPLETVSPYPECYDEYYNHEYDSQYWDNSYYDDSYQEFEQLTPETGAPSSEVNQPEVANPEPQEANFLEWLPSW